MEESAFAAFGIQRCTHPTQTANQMPICESGLKSTQEIDFTRECFVRSGSGSIDSSVLSATELQGFGQR
jgi:hypothetical protein